MVELLPYQPVRVDGSAVDSKGVVDLGGPGLSSQVGLVTVDQAPVAVVITGLASVAQGPAEPLAISAGPDDESEVQTINLEDISVLEEQVNVEVQNLWALTDMLQLSFSSVRAFNTVGWSGEFGAAHL